MLIEGEDFYLNERGYLVFTEKYHRARGYCCGRGCLHCPFNYAAVREPRRSELLQQKQAPDAADKKEE